MSDLRIRMDLENSPEIAAELGHMCVAWSALEYRLFVLFKIIASIPTAPARAIFYSHHATRSRLNMVFDVATMVFQGNELTKIELESLKDLFDRIGKLSKRRNAFIHDPWAEREEGEVYQLRLGGKGIHANATRIEKSHLTHLVSRLNRHAEELYAFHQRVLPMLETLHGRFDKSLSLTLLAPRIHRRKGNRLTPQPRPEPSDA